MNYLNREQRRNMILDAAKRVALQDGLNGLTVRRIAAEAQVSTVIQSFRLGSSTIPTGKVVTIYGCIGELINKG